MKVSFFKRCALKRRELDLDDKRATMENLELPTPGSGGKTPRSMVVLFIKLVLRQALNDGAVGVNLFYDADDDCLRGLEYFTDQVHGVGNREREFYPAPGYIAAEVFKELRWRSGVDRVASEGLFPYRYHGSSCQATVAVLEETEIRFYFTEARPEMRRKG